MIRRRLAACLVGCGIVVALAVADIAWAPGTGQAGRARAEALSIGPITAVFSEPDRATTYSLPDVKDDAGAKISYQWSLTLQKVDPNVGVDLACINHGVLGGTHPTFVWHHGNSGDPVHDDGCNHDTQGIYGHQGLIGVVVTDDRGGRCEATYKGTNSSNASSVKDGVASLPVCTSTAQAPPQAKRRCKCVSLTTRIVPSSLHLRHPNQPRLKLDFTLHWIMNCSVGDTTCLAEVHVYPPSEKINGKKYVTRFVEGHGPHVHFFCKGPCSEITEGALALTLGDERGKELGPIERSSESIPIVVERRCYSAVGYGKLSRLELRIAFDENGRIDLKNSKLG